MMSGVLEGLESIRRVHGIHALLGGGGFGACMGIGAARLCTQGQGAVECGLEQVMVLSLALALVGMAHGLPARLGGVLFEAFESKKFVLIHDVFQVGCHEEL